ncbi:MAG: DUF1080 domain-containing protein [Verrucomicrobiota bacterium]
MNLRAPLVALAVALIASPLFAAEPNTLTAKEKADGWKLLFDGKTLNGWRGYKSEEVGAAWKVQDGAFTLTAAKAGDIMTKGEFADFELTFEWKIASGGNSGVIYRVGLGESASHRTGPEYQVLDNVAAKDNKLGNHLAGSLYDMGPEAPRDLPKPVGEWNQSRLVVKGWKVEHWLNGKQIVTVDLASAEGKALIAGSKFKTVPTFASLAKGHIAFQDHGDVVSYRSIKIRELK